MILYSGLNCKNKDCEQEIFFHHPLFFNKYYPYYIYEYWCIEDTWYENRNRVSCIYTGDTDLNKVKIKSIFKKFWKSVGTIQISHHGDIKSFDKSILNDEYYFCPISVGKTNSYGHPSSKVIADILSQNSCPILITENLSSGFIESIRC